MVAVHDWWIGLLICDCGGGGGGGVGGGVVKTIVNGGGVHGGRCWTC